MRDELTRKNVKKKMNKVKGENHALVMKQGFHLRVFKSCSCPLDDYFEKPTPGVLSIILRWSCGLET